MYCMYQNREELEDDLYKEDEADSDGSEATSELEFCLYSQLHYSSNAGEMEELVDREEEVEGQHRQLIEVTQRTADVEREQEQTGKSTPLSPKVSKLQPVKKKTKREKSDKQKKRKSKPQGQRSSSLSLFEEVIVIDSSPSVISISESNSTDDDDDDDDGVCALKGQSMQRLRTSTPAQQGTQKRNLSLNVPVTVDSSSSDSDSVESESESESSGSSSSDGLESWMILGHGHQDGDCSISLNLERESDSSAGVEEGEEGSWLVSDKDKNAGIFNKDKGARVVVQRLANRYYTNNSVQCRNCDKHGHLSRDCPEPKKLSPCFLCGIQGHPANQCPNRYCSNCGLPGHLYNSCSEKAYWHRRCHRCSMTGHFYDACPEIWRQYHITTTTGTPIKKARKCKGRFPAYCYNCSRKGHFGHACTRQRMFNGTYPTIPFINHYDSVEDIHQRQHRMKLKVKGLRKNCLFPAGSQTHLTPGPPKKKQKISHHKNNHQHKHTPQQSPNNHKPSRSHIFFKDNHDLSIPMPKMKKHNQYKQQISTGNVKPWKPKRPVPISRDPPPKLILDEADDFPRGGGKRENVEVKKKKRSKMRKIKQVPPVPQDNRSDCLRWTVSGETQGSEPKKEKGKRKRRSRARRIADKRAAQAYPTDENLFIIKQRKRSR